MRERNCRSFAVEVHRRRGLRRRGVVDLDHLVVRDRLAIGAIEDRQSLGVELDAVRAGSARTPADHGTTTADTGAAGQCRRATRSPSRARCRIGARSALRHRSPIRCRHRSRYVGGGFVVRTKRARMRTRPQRQWRRPQVSSHDDVPVKRRTPRRDGAELAVAEDQVRSARNAVDRARLPGIAREPGGCSAIASVIGAGRRQRRRHDRRGHRHRDAVVREAVRAVVRPRAGAPCRRGDASRSAAALRGGSWDRDAVLVDLAVEIVVVVMRRARASS